MDLFIQVDDDGKPINHPMLLESLHWFFPDFDPENPPTGYARFKRNWPPTVGPEQTYDTEYKWIDGYYQDVFTIRDLTPEEKAERESHYKEMLKIHNEYINNSATSAMSSVPSNSQPTPAEQHVIILINNVVISFDNKVEVSSANGIVSFYYTFPPDNRVKLDSISETPLESITDLPFFYDGRVGDFYVIKSISAVYAWSGSAWIKVSNDTKSIPANINKEFDQLQGWEFNNSISDDLKVDPETRIERINICTDCEYLSKIKTCKRCGCFMPLKTWLKDDICPINKW